MFVIIVRVNDMKVKRINHFLELTIELQEEMKTIDELFTTYISKKERHYLRMSHQVFINDQPIQQNFSIRLKQNDRLRFPFFIEEEPDFIPQAIPLDVVYEDDYFLIVNKPAHQLVHPDKKDGKDTLVNAVSYYYQKTNQRYRVRYLHRLDYETSGLVMFVKPRLLHHHYDELIALNKVRRHYIAITDGIPKPNKQIIDLPIGRDRHRSNAYRISKTGKYARTRIKTLKTIDNYSLVHCELETGRTHQIRVHLAAKGYPIVGDKLYHPSPKDHYRHALHAYELIFPYPFTHEEKIIKTDIPDEFIQLLKRSRSKN